MEDTIIIGCGIDDRFAMPLAVTLYSALINLNDHYNVKIFVINSGVTEQNEQRLRHVVSLTSRRVDLELVPADPARFAHLASGHLSPAAFFRLLLPNAIPERFSKVIYLDSDLLVRSDLSQVWRMDMLGTPVLAVRDYSGPVVSARATGLSYEKLKIDKNAAYLNSGFMVIDLVRWRADQVAEKVLRYSIENEIRFGDQDGINAVMAGNWGELDPLWNVQLYISVNHILRGIEASPYKECLVRDRWRLIRDAKIWHFVGPRKPWETGCALPGQLHWLRVLKQCGWYEAGDPELGRRSRSIRVDWLVRKAYRIFYETLRLAKLR